jgi:predicted Rossmann fold nucleotide-binding protein DprA/Smf involved in DNA uptake
MDTTFYAGIVGSRRRNTFNDIKIVNRLVEWIVNKHDWHDRPVIVSGGCHTGADAFAEAAARAWSLNTRIYHIDKEGASNRWEFTTRAYERNRKIAETSSAIFALVSEDRTGGTENTIKHALELKKPVYLVTTNGDVYLSPDGKMPTCDPEVRLLDSKSTG